MGHGYEMLNQHLQVTCVSEQVHSQVFNLFYNTWSKETISWILEIFLKHSWSSFKFQGLILIK